MNQFEKDLGFGKAAEQWFVENCPQFHMDINGYTGDLVTSNGTKVELKTERRSSFQTANIFLEVVSNKDKNTPGGARQAKLNGCKYIIYLFWPCKTFFIYDLEKLLAHVDSASYKDFHVKVGSSKAIGHIIPRANLKDCEIELNLLK